MLKKNIYIIEESIKNKDYAVSYIAYYYADGRLAGPHAVVPIGTYSKDDNIRNVIVYDPNHPGMSRIIEFDFEHNIIKYIDVTSEKYFIHASYLTTRKPSLSYSDANRNLEEVLREFNSFLYTAKDKILIFDCPINISITDQYGRIIEDKDNNTILNGKVSIIGDSKVFLLPTDLDYKIHIDAYDSGEFTFSQISPLTNEYASVVSFVNISITENTEAICEITSKDSEYKMEIDYDGDGSIDELITPDVIDIVGTNFYNITFFSPVTTMGQFNLTNGTTLPIKFTAKNSTTSEFAYDDTVNVTITNSTGHLVTYFRNGTGTENVRINPNERQYMVDLDTRNYDMKVGQNNTITVIFGKPNSLRGYALSHFI
jgi:hypothetical protein